MKALELPELSSSFILSVYPIRAVVPAPPGSAPRMTGDRIRSFAQRSVVKTSRNVTQGAR
jgi:hypothetical protein